MSGKGYKGNKDPKKIETSYLDDARRATTAIHALEQYSQHWDYLDKMFGEDNEATKASVEEYQKRISEGKLMLPNNDSDREALKIKEASFLIRRLSYPKDVADALIGMTLFGKKTRCE